MDSFDDFFYTADLCGATDTTAFDPSPTSSSSTSSGSAALATKSEFSSSAITIHTRLLDPDVDRSMAEFDKCRLELFCDILKRHVVRR